MISLFGVEARPRYRHPRRSGLRKVRGRRKKRQMRDMLYPLKEDTLEQIMRLFDGIEPATKLIVHPSMVPYVVAYPELFQ